LLYNLESGFRKSEGPNLLIEKGGCGRHRAKRKEQRGKRKEEISSQLIGNRSK